MTIQGCDLQAKQQTIAMGSAALTIPCPQTIHGRQWDRLPMTIAFMSMVAAIIAERRQSGRGC
jgi:hypothetical protein